MRGDIVIVRSFGGEALVRRVWDIGGKVVYLIHETVYQRLMAGEEATSPTGFPADDVFEYVPGVAERAEGGKRLNWKELRPFKATLDKR